MRKLTANPRSRKIVQLRGRRVRITRASWEGLSRAEFHGLIARICGCERQTLPGAARRHWYRKRLEALEYYERKFGAVPAILRELQLRSGNAFYGTDEYRAWSRSAYQPPAPNRALEATRMKPRAPQRGR
jgi:hypothetical protein